MKKSIYHIFVCSALLMSGWMGSSCSTDRDPDSGFPYQEATLVLSLNVEGRTRSENDQKFEPGSGYENYLDLKNKNFRIYFFDSDDNTYIATFQPSLVPNVTPDDNPEEIEYIFRGSLPAGVGGKFKLAVLANWSEYPEEASSATDDEYKLVKGKTTLKDLTTHVQASFKALTFPGVNGEWLREKDRLIPFYGVRSYSVNPEPDRDDNNNLKPYTYIDLTDSPIPMLRAMARIEVILDNPLASFESVKMVNVNQEGYCSPYLDTDWEFDYTDYFKGEGNWDQNYVRGVHLLNDINNPADPISFKCVSKRSDDGKTPEKWVVYVPEYRNIDNTPSASQSQIEVKLAKTDNDDNSQWIRTIYFTTNGEEPNVNNPAFNIERNNIYRFTVTGMNANIYVKADIQPFASQELTFEFGLMRDERGDLKVLIKRDENGNPIYDENGKLIYPDYFNDFVKNHPLPKEIEFDDDGNPVIGEDGNFKELELGDELEPIHDDYNDDYYAIVVGEYEDITKADIWLKDTEGCRILTNFGDENGDNCRARLVQHFYGLNESEVYYKDIYGYRRVWHYDNHNSIVISPFTARLLFRREIGGTIRYEIVESWDENTQEGYIIVYDSEEEPREEIGFYKITSSGDVLEVLIPLND